MPTKAKNGKKKKKKKSGGGGGGDGSGADGVGRSVSSSLAKPPSSTETEHASSPVPPWVAVEQQHKGVRMSDETKELVQIETIERACNAHDEWTTRPDKVMEQVSENLHIDRSFRRLSISLILCAAIPPVAAVDFSASIDGAATLARHKERKCCSSCFAFCPVFFYSHALKCTTPPFSESSRERS